VEVQPGSASDGREAETTNRKGGVSMSGVEVNAVIDKLADKLAVPAGKLMELLPAIGIKSVVGCVVATICLLIFVPIFLYATRRVEWNDNGYNGDLPYFLTGIFAAVVSLSSAAILIKTFSGVILWLYNPQAWALDYILQMIR
jgi:hypothetical protein